MIFVQIKKRENRLFIVQIFTKQGWVIYYDFVSCEAVQWQLLTSYAKLFLFTIQNINNYYMFNVYF